MSNPKNKKNSDLAALLGDEANDVEKNVTGKENGVVVKTKPQEKAPEPVLNQPGEEKSSEDDGEEPAPLNVKEEPKMPLEDELGLPKSFTRVFKRNSRYEKESKTTTLVYRVILDKYAKVSSAMDVDTVVLVNNVLAEWYNKHLEPVDKVVNQKSDIKAL